MGWREEIAKTKPLFMTIYVTVAIGVVFSAFYVFSAIYSSGTATLAPSTSYWWLPPAASHVDSLPLDQTPNSTQPTAVGVVLVPAPQPQSKLMKPLWEVPPSGSKMPPLKTFRLTKELVQQRVKDNIVIVTFGNYAFMDFILTWVKHLTDLGLDNVLVGAMDTKLLKALYWKGVPVFDMGSHMSTVDVGWGSPTFHKMGERKVILIDSILPFGYELLMCDTDMVWLKNPLPYLAHFPEADVLTSTDQVIPTVVDDRLDIWQQVGAAYNIGIFHWRPTDPSKKLAKEWKDMLLADDKIWDQNGFNELVHRQLGPSVDDDSGLVYAYDGNLKLGLLPASIFLQWAYLFCPGNVSTTQVGAVCSAYHIPICSTGEYFRVSNRIVVDGMALTAQDFSIGTKQIRTGLAIASLLNRTLVMPPLWCRLDRLWFPHPGVLVGTITRQPFLCPLDHVFEVNVMLKEMAEEEFGPGINLREYSFFDNPLMPKQVKESWLDVQLCQEGSQNCNVSNSTSPLGVLKFPKRSNEETKREERFRNRVKRYMGIWCCVENHSPAHIYYDMYWDEKPGWKPAPPQTPQDDHPPW
ncbi:xyloglucanase 113 [Actinidia rufa]|uniref:Xyloglucanase 113 n=1 Tax=Actinidia rufa TaxID=165716 RepID=A0A7J0GCU7_9ERIC|nr:xyloglucanase 113 [Actinidia rufa]